MKKQILSAIGIMTVAIYSANAQQKLSLTVDKSVEIGLQNSPQLRTARSKVSAASARVLEVGASGLPSVKFTGTYTRLSDVPEQKITLPITIPGMSNSFVLSPTILDNINLKLSVQQPIFTGFRVQSGEKASEHLVQASEYDLQKDKSDFTLNVKIAYWNLYKVVELKKVIDENVKQIKAHLQDAQNLQAAGMATTNDILRIQVQLANAQLMQVDMANNVSLAMTSLNNLIGTPLDTEIELSTNIASRSDAPTNLSELQQKAVGERPELKANEQRLKASEQMITQAKAGYYPQIAILGNYNFNNPNSRYFPAEAKFQGTWDVTLSLSYDIWNWNTTSHQTAQAEAQTSQVQDGLKLQRDGVKLEVAQNYLNVRKAKESIAVTQESIKQAEESVRITGEKFKAGLALNSDMLDAETALLQAKSNYTNALVDYEVAMIKLQKAIGEQ